jgi:DNA sulfur modification protein DndE
MTFNRSEAISGNQNELESHLANLPFSMPLVKEPKFSAFSESILKYGAVGDGLTINTKAFAEAIHACVESGGGTVDVPPGTWLTGPIKLESNINLHLEKGAIVQFSKRNEDFPLINGLDGKSKKFSVTPLLYAFQATNIGITGDGILDGAGEAWRPVKKQKLTSEQWKDLISSGGAVSADGKIWWPSKEAMEGEEYLHEFKKSGKKPTIEEYKHVKEFLRPHMVQIVQCDGVLIDGPTFQNSPKFHIYPVQSENLIIRNVKILTQWYAQNGDGLDLNSCRNVIVYDVTVNAGDDAICIKPGRISEYQKPGPACQNIVIANCVVYRGHGGFVIGSESYGGAKNISVKNCVFIGTDVGLRFKSLRGRGGLVENIFIDGIQMRNIADEGILFDMHYDDSEPKPNTTNEKSMEDMQSVSELTPKFQNFEIKNIVINGANQVISINGLSEMAVKKINIENVLGSSEKGVCCTYAENISLKNSKILQKSGPFISLNQCKNIIFDKLEYPKNSDVFLDLKGSNSANIQIENIDVGLAKKDFYIGSGVQSNVIINKQKAK